MKICVLDGYGANPGDLDWAPIAALGQLTVWDATPPEKVQERMAGAEIVITNKTVLSGEAIQAAKELRYIGLLSTGYNVVDLDTARARGIPVCNVPAYSTEAVAQHTFALLLEITNHVGQHTAAVQRDRRWVSSPSFCFWDAPLMELKGKTLGIIGYGRIGQAVADIARAFGMRALATARHLRPGLVPLETVLAESDVISLHCPLFADNRGLINAKTIAQMKDGVILLNTARGPLIDEQALKAALESGKVAAAGLDVIDREPMPADCPLLGLDNCIITPHIAWAPRETRERLLGIVAENIRCFQAGRVQNDVTR